MDCMFRRQCYKPNTAYETVVANAHAQHKLLREMKKNAATTGASRYMLSGKASSQLEKLRPQALYSRM